MGDADERGGDGKPRSWLTFAIGVAVGIALSGLVVAGALAQQRRARRVLPWNRHRATRAAPPGATMAKASSESTPSDASGGMRAARSWPEDTELDEELEQTFPASDPLPYSHRVD